MVGMRRSLSASFLPQGLDYCHYIVHTLNSMVRSPITHIFVLLAFLLNVGVPASFSQARPVQSQAGEFKLPVPGVMVRLSQPFDPPMLKGIKVHPDNPFRFDFILDTGDGSKPSLQQESTKLIKYFLAGLTIPEKDLWVNLSPYEKDRIIPNSFGLTEMGRDLLAEDYMLKQITASLIYPQDKVGKRFWERVYEEAEKKFGTTNIPVNTFNKVWIVPEKAVVYENAKTETAYVVEAKLKVMLEEDYLALSQNQMPTRGHVPEGALSPSRLPSELAMNVKAPQGNNCSTNAIGSQIIREIVIPELTKEVNENKNFAQLRQVYSSLILATWYKKKIKDSILAEAYNDKNKIQGLSVRAQNFVSVQDIYQRYLQAFKKGVFNYIKEEIDPMTRTVIPRKYFSGGADLINMNKAMLVTNNPAFLNNTSQRLTRLVLVAAAAVGLGLSSSQNVFAQQLNTPTAPSQPAFSVANLERAGYQGPIYNNYMIGIGEEIKYNGLTDPKVYLNETSPARQVIKIIENYQHATAGKYDPEVLQGPQVEAIRALCPIMGITPETQIKEISKSFTLFITRDVAKYLGEQYNIVLLPEFLIHRDKNTNQVFVKIHIYFYSIDNITARSLGPEDSWGDSLNTHEIDLGGVISLDGDSKGFAAVAAQAFYGNVFIFPNNMLEYIKSGFQNTDTVLFTNTGADDGLRASVMNIVKSLSSKDSKDLLTKWIVFTLAHEGRHIIDRKKITRVADIVQYQTDFEINGYLAGMRTGYDGWAFLLGSAFYAKRGTHDSNAVNYVIDCAVEYIQSHPKSFNMIKGKEKSAIRAELYKINDPELLKRLADDIYLEHKKSNEIFQMKARKISADAAMNAKGGIDFSPNSTALEIRNGGGGMKFHLDPAMLKQLQNAPGFVPVIINIQPLASLSDFLEK